MKAKKALSALSALSQESRLAAFIMLMAEESGLPAGEIALRLNVPATTMSFHLAQLRSAGLVETIKKGKSVIYSANRKKAKKLAKYIGGKKSGQEEKYLI